MTLYFKKMILIFSEEEDVSSNLVMDWLTYFDAKCIRINPDKSLFKIKIELSNNKQDILLYINNKLIRLSDISVFWYRRGNLSNLASFIKFIEDGFSTNVFNHLKHEFNTIEKYIVYSLSKKHHLGDYYQGNANKLISLLLAKEVGLNIPNTIVSDKKEDLVEFIKKEKNIITKGVQDTLTFKHDNSYYYNYTDIPSKVDVEEMCNYFFPSLLQCNIVKRYELRIFYLCGKFYSMAIFSQQDYQTKIDFRHYNDEKPNRNVPYQLPIDIENKLDSFMKNMGLDTGSIDMILTQGNEYVFLEVNPVGQYDMVSVACNYYLDEEVAKYLVKCNHEK